MTRAGESSTIDEILRQMVEPVLRRASASIVEALGEMTSAHLDHELKGSVARARGPAASPRPRPRRRAEMTRWVADRHARRVPLFVIEMTNGLDTKKKVVARFGPDAAFEKGKPLPKSKPGA
jgi:hypothetical protein